MHKDGIHDIDLRIATARQNSLSAVLYRLSVKARIVSRFLHCRHIRLTQAYMPTMEKSTVFALDQS